MHSRMCSILVRMAGVTYVLLGQFSQKEHGLFFGRRLLSSELAILVDG